MVPRDGRSCRSWWGAGECMKHALLLAMVMMSLLPAALVSAQLAATNPHGVVRSLRALRDHSRPLLVFAPTGSDARLLGQMRLLAAHGNELNDRQVLPIAIVGSGAPEPQVGLNMAALSPEEAAAARRRFQIAPEAFVVLLLGKDGGEKLRSDQPIAYETLRDTVDAMPMRQHEMREPR